MHRFPDDLPVAPEPALLAEGPFLARTLVQMIGSAVQRYLTGDLDPITERS